MRAFFKGWRRKVGCVALAMALAFMGMWFRSRVTEDLFVYYTEESIIGFSAATHGISWTRYTPWLQDDLVYPAGWWKIEQSEASPSFGWDRYEPYAVIWRWQWLGFDFGERKEEHYTKQLIDWTIPYWSLILPVTLLSAALILWPQRK